jgi:flagellum-specific peptidoglycan hydrolase FlgJ
VPAVSPISIQTLREPTKAHDQAALDTRFADTLEATASAENAGNTVPAVRTPLSAAQAQEALRAAWEKVTGAAPSDKTLALITAQWAHETGHGASMFNYNFAGIKGAGPGGLTVRQHTREGFGAAERRIVDNFRAYSTAEEGATDYVKLLARRFPEAVEGATGGDPAAFVHGLKSRGYFTGHEGAYLNNVTALASRFLGEPLGSPAAAPPELQYNRVSGTAPLDLQGLYAQMTAPADSYVDALSITDQINRAALHAFSNQGEDS